VSGLSNTVIHRDIIIIIIIIIITMAQIRGEENTALSKVEDVYNTYDLDEDSVSLYCDAFKLKAKDGMRIRTEDLAPVLWSIGLNPTEAQIKHICTTFDRMGTGFLSFQHFLKLMSDPKLRIRNETKEEFIATFSVLDKGRTGFVDARELLEMLTTLGDTLTVEEAKRLISMSPITSDNRINIRRFADELLS